MLKREYNISISQLSPSWTLAFSSPTQKFAEISRFKPFPVLAHFSVVLNIFSLGSWRFHSNPGIEFQIEFIRNSSLVLPTVFCRLAPVWLLVALPQMTHLAQRFDVLRALLINVLRAHRRCSLFRLLRFHLRTGK